MKSSTAIVAPIVSVIAFVLQGIFHITLTQDATTEISQVVMNLVLAGIAIEGIIRNHDLQKK